MPAYDYSMDPSGFCLLSDYVPSAVPEIRYFSTFNFVGERVDGYEEPCAIITPEQYENRMLLQRVMCRHGFVPYECEWWHFTLEREPYPDMRFSFPVSSAYLKRGRA